MSRSAASRAAWCGPIPDLDHAAELMRWAYTNCEQARAIGERARADMRSGYSPETVGALVRARLQHVAARG